MKTNIKLSLLALTLVLGASCTKMDEIQPQSGTLTSGQLEETTTALPGRADALYAGMYALTGKPDGCNYAKPDDWGFIMIAFSGDIEAADVVLPDNNYNWFSTCGEMSSRNPNYRNPYIRYSICYNVIAAAHDVMRAYGVESTAPEIKARIGEAYAMRAFAYMNLAPYFQFSFAAGGAEKPCVPLVTLNDTIDFTHNPRATLTETYNLIIADLNIAIEKLDGWQRKDKSKIDQQVCYGLLSRAYLYMGKYAEAAEAAAKAMKGYTPATIKEVSKPFLYNISEHNWIWGYDMTSALAEVDTYATTTSWLRCFSGDSYSAGTGTYAMINNLLYDMIPASDVRKGWWVNEDLESPLLEGQVWDNLVGQEISKGEIEDVKMQFLPYTNVKFGVEKYGTVINDEDWCYMRYEEMLLNQVEGLAKSGHADEAAEILTQFMQKNRDPKYSVDGRGLSLENEIWFQRRVELWGEGFSNVDTRRLNKPVVRFHEGKPSNQPDYFKFNMAADDGWLLMRFPEGETNTNFSIINNEDGKIPDPGQNGNLRDGVTDNALSK